MPYTPNPTDETMPPDVVGGTGATAATAAAEFRAIKLYMKETLLAGIASVNTAIGVINAALTALGNEKKNKLESYNNQTGTAYTLVAADNNKVITLTNTDPIALTLPNDLPEGFFCYIMQKGAGHVTSTAGVGASLNGSGNKYKLATQWAQAKIRVISNGSGNSAAYVISGETSL